jgi:hypothetical protein
MTYHYIRSEPGLWTVGTGTPRSQGGTDWEPESDHNSPAGAAARVRWLNGEDDGVEHQAIAEALDLIDRFDTFGDSGRTRAFVGDLRRILGGAQ